MSASTQPQTPTWTAEEYQQWCQYISVHPEYLPAHPEMAPYFQNIPGPAPTASSPPPAGPSQQDLELQTARREAETLRNEVKAANEREAATRKQWNESTTRSMGSPSFPMQPQPEIRTYAVQVPPSYPNVPPGSLGQDAQYLSGGEAIPAMPSKTMPAQVVQMNVTTSEAQPRTKGGMPLGALTRGPGMVLCPACGVTQVTVIEYESGNNAHMWAIVLCLFTGFFCIPYMFPAFKDVQHKCSHCGALLATWQRSGGTTVHQFNAM